jgi:hypothetical protein
MPESHHSRDERRQPESEIVFSTSDGYVWASWPGCDGAIKLGRLEMIAAMMQDFLEQEAIARRLCG